MGYAGRKIVAVVFARTSSSRFVEKMRHCLLAGTVLDYVITRTAKIRHVDTVVVATTSNAEDDWIEKKCSTDNVNCFRGSENDVVERLYLAINEFAPECEIVVRVCADNPFLSYDLMSREIEVFINNNSSLYTPFERNLHPFGFSAVIMKSEMVSYIHHNAVDQRYREHVENFILETDERQNVSFSTRSLQKLFFPWLSLTFDMEKDLLVINKVDKLREQKKVSDNLDDLLDYICSENFILICPKDSLDVSYIDSEWSFLKNLEVIEYDTPKNFSVLVKQYDIERDAMFGDVWFFNATEEAEQYYDLDFAPRYCLRLSKALGTINISVIHGDRTLTNVNHVDVFDNGDVVFMTAILQSNIGFFVSDNIRGIEQGGIWIRQKNKYTMSSKFCGFHEAQIKALPHVFSEYPGTVDPKNHNIPTPFSPFSSVRIDNEVVYLFFPEIDENNRLGSLSKLPLPLIWMSNSTLEKLSEVDCC